MPDTASGDHEIRDAIAHLREAIQKACSMHKIKLVALSGGLDSSIIAWHAKRAGNPAGIAVIARDFVSPDLEYCQMAAAGLDIPLSISYATTEHLLDYAKETIKILENFNEIEIRNNIVMYAAAKWAAENGYDAIATGDGADELFAGYRFMINTPQDKLESEIKRVCSIMHFPSHKICRSLGITAVSPFLEDTVIEAAENISAKLKVREDAARGHNANGTSDTTARYGKWILRKAFEDVLPPSIVWRPKAAMQDGSGTAGLTRLFESATGASREACAEKIQQTKDRDGVIIRNLESFYYYDIFRGMFGTPAKFQSRRKTHAEQNAGSSVVDHSSGMDKPHKDDGGRIDADSTASNAHSSRRCPYCKYTIDAESRFCRMCAAFPI